MHSSVEIHEFSTGIIPEKLPDGGWVSRGFTGNYMNSTLDEIPYAVYRSIVNKDFAVAEGTASDIPTFIGRDIENWSVIALITKGRDEKGRAASFYRYFLTQINEGLSILLAFIEEREKQGLSFTFDPFDFREAGQPHAVSMQVLNAQLTNRSVTNPCREIPCLLDSRESYEPVFVNQLAMSCSQSSSQPTAWAFNVEALEKPYRFQVIYPASVAAYQRIRESILSTPRALSNSLVDEQAIKTALKSLINSSNAKPEHLSALVANIDAVENTSSNVPTNEFWNSLFNSQGAENAIRQKIYSSPMTRLLTLRAIVMPETLSNFLEWIGKIPDTNQKQEQENVSLSLQNQIAKFLGSSILLQRLALTGANFLLDSTFTENSHLEEMLWLINSQEGFWRKSLKKQTKDAKDFASQFNQQGGMDVSAHYAEQLSVTGTWRTIVYGFRNSTSLNIKNNPKYINAGNFFWCLREPVLAACCFQSGRGLVPPEVYDEASRYPDFNNGIPYGIRLIRGKTLFEKFSGFLFNPIAIVIILLSTLTTLIYIFGPSAIDLVRNMHLITDEEEASTEGNSESIVPEANSVEANQLRENGLIQGTSLPGNDELYRARADFESVTVPVIQSLANELLATYSQQNSIPFSNNQTTSLNLLSEEEAVIRIASTLLGRDFNLQEQKELGYFSISQYSGIEQVPEAVKDRWVAMIRSYQSRNALTPDGYLSSEGETYEILREELLYSTQNRPQPPILPDTDPNSIPDSDTIVPELDMPEADSQENAPPRR